MKEYEIYVANIYSVSVQAKDQSKAIGEALDTPLDDMVFEERRALTKDEYKALHNLEVY